MYEEETIPGSDVSMDILNDHPYTMPKSPMPEFLNPGTEWHRKTDWSVDGIIGSDD